LCAFGSLLSPLALGGFVGRSLLPLLEVIAEDLLKILINPLIE
jgi:hypothetical protein